MLQILSSLHSSRNSTIYSGDVTTFVEKDQVQSPSNIAMNHEANCFYVTTNDAHSITKITSLGRSKAAFLFFFPFFFQSIIVNPFIRRKCQSFCWKWTTRKL